MLDFLEATGKNVFDETARRVSQNRIEDVSGMLLSAGIDREREALEATYLI
jgi:hypothetical protein